MKNKQAFTLIELLVVVLIIGILAAVAVPQYQVAVKKAKLSNYIVLANAIVKAQELYYLSNGSFARDLQQLDITYPAGCMQTNANDPTWVNCKEFSIDWSSSLSTCEVTVTNASVWSSGDIYYAVQANIPGVCNGKRHCYASESNVISQKVCQSLGGSPTGSTHHVYGKIYELP